MNKRGISAIVAVVLTILITVAAIIILWNSVIPIIKEEILFEDIGRVSIVTGDGYTYCDPDSGVISVQVMQAVSDTNADGIKIILSCDGNSITSDVYEAPGPNNKKIYEIFIDEPGIDVCSCETASVVPVVDDKEGGSSSKETIGEGKFDGDMDDVECAGDDCGECYWGKRTLTCSPLDYALVSHWDFESGADDVKGLNDGTLENGSIIVLDNTDRGNVFYSNASSGGHVNVPDSSSLDITGEITLSAWVRLDSYIFAANTFYQFPKVIIKPHTSYGTPWELYALSFKNGGDEYMFLVSNGTVQGGTSALDVMPLNEWHHIVGVYNITTAKIYDNGKLVGSNSMAFGILGTNNKPLTIGSRLGTHNSMNGSIDDAMIFNMSLSGSEVKRLYCSQGGSC